jgi:hypothetical protein
MDESVGLLCIKNIDEFLKLTQHIESIRVNSSYYSFIKSNQDNDGTIGTNNNEGMLTKFNLKNLKMMISLIKLLLYIAIIVISFCGNLLMICVICTNSFMKKSTNYFILNLGICNLAIVCSCM